MLLLSYLWSQDTSTINFTEEEKAWIKNHPIIHVANEIDWPPFDYNEFGKPKGMAIDHINLLAEKIGVEIDYVYGYTWSELIELFKEKKIDVLPAFYKNESRKEFTLYTPPYYKSTLGIFINSDYETRDNTDLLHKRVGIETAHGSIPYIKELFPGIEITEVDKMEDLVKMLATNELDVIIGNPFVFYHYARVNQVINLKLSSYVEMSEEDQNDNSIHIGIRNDWPLFHQIVQKAMNSTSNREMNKITQKWTDISIVSKIDWSIVTYISGAILTIILFLVWNNWLLKRMVNRKTGELKKLNDELETKVQERTKELTDANSNLNHYIEELKTLKGIIPICSCCKQIRDDEGAWNQMEQYITEHSKAEFSHSLCPTCAKEFYPDISDSLCP